MLRALPPPPTLISLLSLTLNLNSRHYLLSNNDHFLIPLSFFLLFQSDDNRMLFWLSSTTNLVWRSKPGSAAEPSR